jgi:hypothetical protein
MISLRRQNLDLRPPIEPRRFREAMSRPAVARELFLPLEQAWWDGNRFTLGRWAASAARPSLRGVRLQEPAPDSVGPPPERDTQGDLCSLVDSVTELRRNPELSGIVLSEETLIGRQQGPVPGKRVLFGLNCPPGGRYLEDTPAAGECHRVVKRAVKRAGYVIAHPREPYNPLTGFAGLRDWAGAVRLRRKPDPRRWLLLLLLPLLFLPWQCLSSLRNRNGDLSGSGDTATAQKAPGKDGESAKAQGSDGKGSPDKGGGGGSGGGGKGGAGGGDGGAGKNPNANNQPLPFPRATNNRPLPEEAGPPTTIPSKMVRPPSAGQPFPAPPRVPAIGSSRRYPAD